MTRPARTALALLLVGLAAACAARRSGEGGPTLAPVRVAEAPPLVVGTVVDARSGLPVEGAAVAGPGGTSATTGPDGRFRLKGLPSGASGPLAANAPDGRSGEVALRPVEGPAPLEVVIHVR